MHKLCKEYNNDLRWLVASLSDTGMRLGKGVSLLKSDMNLYLRYLIQDSFFILGDV